MRTYVLHRYSNITSQRLDPNLVRISTSKYIIQADELFRTSHRDLKPLICLLCLLLRRCLKVLGNGCYAPIERKQLLNSEVRPEAGLVPVAREQVQT